ncbi:MAG TPA: hypothetical protein VMY37_37000 [Thermoguttaceae bacterium]|nr:hypothetical protein [Thermoguttaceae bacterium]
MALLRGAGDFVDQTATVTLTEREIVARAPRRNHYPPLVAAGFDRVGRPSPWLGRECLELVFG